MKTTILVIVAALLAVLGLVAPAGATRYYVKPTGSDVAAGTSLGTAWATPQHAAATLAAGDSCSFEDGQYIGITAVSPVNSGTAGARITYFATGTKCYWSNAVDLPEGSFVAVTANTYRLYPLSASLGGLTWTSDWRLWQTHYTSFAVIDSGGPTNYVRFMMSDTDGGQMMCGNANTPFAGFTVAGVDSNEGAEAVISDTLFVNRFGPGGPVVGDSLYFSHNSLVLDVDDDWLVFNGIKFGSGDSKGTVVQFQIAAAHDTLRDSHIAGNLAMNGDSCTAVRDSCCHVIDRSADGDWRFDQSAGGQALTIGEAAQHNAILSCVLWHSNNGLATGGDSTLVDGLVIHGCPNHAWLQANLTGLTVRNLLQYNCQDGFYAVNMNGMLVENCTSFGGVLGVHTTSGHATFRNCILSRVGGASADGAMIGTTAPLAESLFTFINCVFADSGSQSAGDGIILHTDNGLQYSLAGYLAYQFAHPGEHYATFIDCVHVTGSFAGVLVGGVWPTDTDAWDARITGISSLAYNTGVTSGAVTDIVGRSRPLSGLWDIGAYEYYASLFTRLRRFFHLSTP